MNMALVIKYQTSETCFVYLKDKQYLDKLKSLTSGNNVMYTQVYAMG